MARSQTSFLRLSALALAGGSFVLLSAPSYAGFQWSPPPQQAEDSAIIVKAAADNGPVMPAMPQGPVEATALGKPPVGGGDAPPIINPNPMAKPVIVAAPPVTPSVPSETPVAAPAPSAEYAVAEGFGSDIPLALAMRQIVPPQYAYSFDSSVDQGAKITWSGGKPWNEVLNDAMKPLNYSVSIADNTARVAPTPAQTATLSAPLPPVVPVVHEAPPPAPSPVAASPIREVYVRRSGLDKEIEQRVPGSPEAVTDQNSVTLSAKSANSPDSQEGDPGFWSKVNPVNWMKSDDAPVVTSDKVSAGPVLTAEAQDAPAPVVLSRGPGDVSPAAPEAKTQAMPDVRFWQAEQGDSLKNVLQTWSDAANVQLYWVPPQDFKLPKAVRLQGSFADALSSVLSAYDDQKLRPVGRLHPNLPTGPAVLIIEPSAS